MDFGFGSGEVSSLVLVEPRIGVAPTIRRRGKAKRSKDMSQTGTIQHYFAKLYTQKEWSTNCENDGATVDGGDGGARKRKTDSWNDGSKQRRMLEKSRRIMVEEIDEPDDQTNSNLGARSETGDGPTDRQGRGASGLEFKSLTRKKVEWSFVIGQDGQKKLYK